MQTDLQAIKNVAISLLYIEPEVIPELPTFLIHPYFENSIMYSDSEHSVMDIINNPKALYEMRDIMTTRINNSNNAEKLFILLRPQYRLTFFKYTNKFMDMKDYKNLLIFSWINTEFPSSDKNVKKREIISYFKKLKYISDLPETTTIYRGVGSEKYRNGISWTLDKDKAKWFSTRFSKSGILYSAQVKNKDILYYISERNEKEIIVDPRTLINIEECK